MHLNVDHIMENQNIFVKIISRLSLEKRSALYI